MNSFAAVKEKYLCLLMVVIKRKHAKMKIYDSAKTRL